MLYEWLEAQRALTRAALTWSASLGRFCGVPATDEPPQGMPGGDWLRRLLQGSTEPPPFGIAQVPIGGRNVPVDETVVDRTPFCELRRFVRSDGPNPGCSILLSAPLAGHHAVMLREAVQTLLADGDVYVTDWADARDVPLPAGRFGLDDYVLTVERFMTRLADTRLHVVAVCQATAPSVAAAALLAARGTRTPLSLTLMGGPIDARRNPTAIGRFAASHSVQWFCDTLVDTVPAGYRGVGRRVYPGYLQHAALVTANPHRQFALESRYWASRVRGDDAQAAAALRSLDEYAAVLDMTEDYFVDTLRVVFKEHRLVHGTWEVDGRPVAPEVLRAAGLMTVEGACDDITGAGQTHAAHAVLSAAPSALREQLSVSDCDHYDLFTGPRWREEIHPALVRFWHRVEEYVPVAQRRGLRPCRSASRARVSL